MRKLLPMLLAVVGLIGGGGAGFLLRPPPEEKVAINPCGDPEAGESAHDAAIPGKAAENDPEALPAHEYVKLNNQFVVPIVHSDEVTSLAILSISLEVEAGMSETVFAREPKLRDEFLQVLFEHANAGGFEGNFTSTGRVDALRTALLEAAQAALGKGVSQVLIVDFVRQDS